MNIDPDAPWIANLFVLFLVAIVPSVFAIRAKREAKKSIDTAEAAHVDTTEKLGRVLHNVENSHNKGLRDDLDDKVTELSNLLNTMVNTISDVASDIRGARRDIGNLHSDITFVRSDIRRNRSRLNNLDRRFEDVLDQAQAMVDEHHPGSSSLRSAIRSAADVDYSEA